MVKSLEEQLKEVETAKPAFIAEHLDKLSISGYNLCPGIGGYTEQDTKMICLTVLVPPLNAQEEISEDTLSKIRDQLPAEYNGIKVIVKKPGIPQAGI